MPGSPASEGSPDSPDSPDGSPSAPNAGAKASVSKDKECPYCHQSFTSSSLGRHLDQFISKKKPDGVHDVDEIRKLRGGITRRMARGSRRDLKDKDRDEPRSTHASPPPAVSAADELNRVPPGGLHTELNRLNWMATGVITNPAASFDTPVHMSPVAAVPMSPSKRSFSTFAQDSNGGPDTARALELALREVLDSLRAISRHASPQPAPFPFDIPSQTFPALCLKILPAPATLFAASPFATPQSIPITPPGPDQLHPLRQKITYTIDAWKWQSLRLAQPTTSNIADEADFLSRSAAQWTESALSHLETSYQNWIAHPAEVRDLLWHVEILRCFQSEQQKTKELEEKMEALQQEANQLQQQVEHLSRCQWPREMALWPPERRTYGQSMRQELIKVNLNKVPGPDGIDVVAVPEHGHTRGDKWDFDKLVNKWKTHLKEDKNRRLPQMHASVDATDLKRSDLTKNGVVNGTMNGDERRRGSKIPKGNIGIISDL